MDDTFRNIAISLFAFLGLHGGLHERARRAAVQQVEEAFNGTGQIRAFVAPRGFFGLETNDLYEVDIDASNIKTDQIPFYIYPRSGWKGDIRYLRLHLRHFMLRNIPVRAFDAELPHATYDLGHTIYRGKLVLRGVGAGPGTVTLGAEGVLAFIHNKKQFQQILSDVKVELKTGKIFVTGIGDFPLVGRQPFAAVGKLIARAGRYVDLDPANTVLTLNGLTQPNSLLNLINPVVDIDDDLGLRGYFAMQGIDLIGDQLVITGVSTLPVALPGTKMP